MKNNIRRNTDFYCLSVAALAPSIATMKNFVTALEGGVLLCIFICLYLKTPIFKKMRKIKGIDFFFLSIMVSGGLIGIFFQVKNEITPQSIYLAWVFYSFCIGMYASFYVMKVKLY